MRQDIISRKPLVSIIVVTYNSSKTIVETLESMKHQTYSNLELIVSDDCSTDNTVEVCKEWLRINGSRFRRTELVTSPKNTGIAPNFNRGLVVAQGEWIKTIAGDDALFPYLIEEYISYIEHHPDVKFLHSDVVAYVNSFEESNRLAPRPTSKFAINRKGISANEQFQILLRQCPIWAATSMFKREVFETVGFFDESLPMWEDRPMWLNMTKHNIKLTYVNIVGAKYRVNENSVRKTDKMSRLFSPFEIRINEAYAKRYLNFLPLPERIAKAIKIKRMVLLEKCGLNVDHLLIKLFIRVTDYPLNKFLKKIDYSGS